VIKKLMQRGWELTDSPDIAGNKILLGFDHEVYCCEVVLVVTASDLERSVFTELWVYAKDTVELEELGYWNNLTMNWDAFEKICEEADCND